MKRHKHKPRGDHVNPPEVVNEHIGPTGKFPDGKMNDDDEGEIAIMVTNSKGNVVIDFGKPIAWIGLPHEQAIGLCTMIMKHAETAKNYDPNKEQ